MAKVSVEDAVVKGHHAYLSNIRIGDIYDCFPEMDNLHDPDAVVVMSAGDIVGHVPFGFANHVRSIFTEFRENVTVLW